MVKKKTQSKRRPINRITNTDSIIFGSVFKARRPLPIKRLALRTNMSWPTVSRSVKKLKDFGVVDINKSIRRTNISINKDFLKKIRKKKR